MSQPPCTIDELRHSLPTRNNPSGLARGNYTSPVPAGLPGGVCPPGGCPPNWISSDDPKLKGFDREMIDLITTQRGFELNSQAIQAGDQILQQISNLRRG